MKEFDVILVYSFGRENLPYLSIIKYLSPRYKIGLLLSDDKDFYARPQNSTFAKLKDTENKIRALCVQYGAEKIYVNEKYKCKLLLMYPFAYAEDYLQKIRANIRWDKLIGIFFHARGFRKLDILKEMGASKYFAPAKFLIEMIAKSEEIYGEMEGLNIIEAGFPYKKYPLFDGFNLDIDYLIALPSLALLKRNKGKERYLFLKNLSKALNKLDRKAKIYLKHHNVKDQQRFHRRLPGSQLFMELGRLVCEFFAKLSLIPSIKNKFYFWTAIFLHNIIEKKYPSLEEVTKHHNLGIELFLPYVRKGLFTGLSGTVFHALFNKLPVYNCDSQNVKDNFAVFYRYFYIPCCNSSLSFDENSYNLIPEEVRQADIISLLEKELVQI